MKKFLMLFVIMFLFCACYSDLDGDGYYDQKANFYYRNSKGCSSYLNWYNGDLIYEDGYYDTSPGIPSQFPYHWSNPIGGFFVIDNHLFVFQVYPENKRSFIELDSKLDEIETIAQFIEDDLLSKSVKMICNIEDDKVFFYTLFVDESKEFKEVKIIKYSYPNFDKVLETDFFKLDDYNGLAFNKPDFYIGSTLTGFSMSVFDDNIIFLKYIDSPRKGLDELRNEFFLLNLNSNSIKKIDFENSCYAMAGQDGYIYACDKSYTLNKYCLKNDRLKLDSSFYYGPKKLTGKERKGSDYSYSRSLFIDNNYFYVEYYWLEKEEPPACYLAEVMLSTDQNRSKRYRENYTIAANVLGLKLENNKFSIDKFAKRFEGDFVKAVSLKKDIDPRRSVDCVYSLNDSLYCCSRDCILEFNKVDKNYGR